MTRTPGTDGSSTEASNEPDWTTSRRRVLMGVGGAGLAFGLARSAGQQARSFEFGGEVEGWRGRSPESISGQTNPTLMLQAGQQYEVVWENLDGQPHNFVVRDADGNQLVRSDIVSERGATQTVVFTATEAMTTYLCEVHPNTMVGEISLGGSSHGGTGGSTPTDSQSGGGGFFRQGAEVGYQTVADGMTAPTDFAVPDDGSGRQFVADQTGEVWVVTDEGRREEPFVDVSDRMVTLGEFNGSYADPTQEYDERGLLGIAFHPAYADNRRFFLHYSAPPNENTPEGWDHVEVLSEFTADEAGERAQPDSERVLLQIQSPQYNHDAGNFGFGPDGYLYFPMGDGGGADDDMYGHVDDWYERNAGGNGQDVTDNLLGSILRIDVDAREDGKPYGIPDDNPFVGTDGLDEIYAYGFRNPFGMSFDSEGNLFQADAGQNLWEEVSVVERGGNYGWNVKEGTHCFSTENPSDPMAITDCPSNEPGGPPYDGGPLVDPVVEFPHTYRGESVGITIVGGHRYEATTVPELEGKYLFGAWTADPARAEPAGRVLAATPPADFGGAGGTAGTPTGTGTATGTATGTPGTETVTPPTVAGTPDGATGVPERIWEMEELVFAGEFDYFVRMFGQGTDGEVYVLVSRNGVPSGDTGALLRLVPPGEGQTPAPGTETPTGTATGTEASPEATGTDGATETGTPTGTETAGRGGDVGFGIIASLFAMLGSAALLVRGRDGDG